MPNIITPPAMLSFPALLTPRLGPNPKPGQLAAYGCTLVFPKGADLTAMKTAAMTALKEKFGDQTEKLLKNGQIKIPFRKDEDKYDPEKWEYFINVSSKQNKPGIVDRYQDPVTKKPAPLTDADKLYPGCIVKASVSVYTYDTSGNKGVSFGLQHIQWWEHGTRLDNRRSAADSFEAEALADGGLDSLNPSEPGGNLNDLLG